MSKPTPGAMRAAKLIRVDWPDAGRMASEVMATIIDRETSAPALLAALEKIRALCDRPTVVAIADAAIKEAEKPGTALGCVCPSSQTRPSTVS